jgi:hypothetical protein
VNEDEVADLLNRLEQALIVAGLSSLVNQERMSAVEGRAEKLTTADMVRLHGRFSRQGTRRVPQVRADDIRIRPLSVNERLAELLDLVEVAIGGSYAIETRLRDEIKIALDAGDDANSWTGDVVFADPPESELSGAARREWDLPDQLTLRQRGAAVREVLLLINQLRQQAQLPRSEQLHRVTDPEADKTALDIPGGWS